MKTSFDRLEQIRMWQADNPEKMREYKRAYKRRNREKIRNYDRTYKQRIRRNK